MRIRYVTREMVIAYIACALVIVIDNLRGNKCYSCCHADDDSDIERCTNDSTDSSASSRNNTPCGCAGESTLSCSTVACRVGVTDGIVVNVAVAVEVLRVRRPAPARAPRPARDYVARPDRQRVAAGDDRVGRDEAADGRIIIPGSIEQWGSVGKVLRREPRQSAIEEGIRTPNTASVSYRAVLDGRSNLELRDLVSYT